MNKIVPLFLRISIAFGFLSAVADRFGLWSEANSTWGNWQHFLAYTGTINPWFPAVAIPVIGVLATGLEVVLAIWLLTGFKTSLAAKMAGVLLLIFALSMTFSSGIKGAFDYSVFIASAGAFALATLTEKK